MGMVKIISPHGWDFDGPVVAPIKISSRGLIGNDRSDFVKRASHAFLDVLDNIKAAKDEEPVHVLSHGATEAYGPNRNGDGFKEATCREYHSTFEKFARWYRNHKNKDPQTSYGIIKKSAYNETMRRVELLAFLNKEKSAAERNGGLVADKEMEKLARGEDIAVSMACRVPYDTCSWCGNQARTRDDYCKEASCKAGGCKDNLTRLVKVGNDVHQLHVDNPRPTWFDMSNVFRPADRIAYANRADYLTKAASDGWDGIYGVCSNKVATDLGISAPLAVMMLDDSYRADFLDVDLQVKLAAGLDRLERQQLSNPTNELYKLAFDDRLQGKVDHAMLGEPGTQKCAEALAALAAEKIILPLREFARLTKKAELIAPATVALSGVYGRMISDGSLERRLRNNPFALATKTASAQLRRWVLQLREGLSLEKAAVDRRCQLASIRSYRMPVLETGIWSEKSASDKYEAEELARAYALYKVAALQRIAAFDDEFMLTARLGIVQNQMI